MENTDEISENKGNREGASAVNANSQQSAEDQARSTSTTKASEENAKSSVLSQIAGKVAAGVEKVKEEVVKLSVRLMKMFGVKEFAPLMIALEELFNPRSPLQIGSLPLALALMRMLKSLSVNEGYAYAGLAWMRERLPVNPETGESYSISHISEVITDLKDKGLLVKKRNKKNSYLLNPVVVEHWDGAMKNIAEGNMPGADEMVEITIRVGAGVPVGGTVLSEVAAGKEERKMSRKARKFSESAGYYKAKREAAEREAQSRLEVGGLGSQMSPTQEEELVTRLRREIAAAEAETTGYEKWVASVVGKAGEVGEVIAGLIAKHSRKVIMSESRSQEVCGWVKKALVRLEIGCDEWVGRLAREIVYRHWEGGQRTALPY